MNLIKCANGHFFDADLYPSCPHCSGGVGDNNLTMPYTDKIQEEPLTMPLSQSVQTPEPAQEDNSLQAALNRAISSSVQDDDEKTISVYQQSGGEEKKEPVVGWLVCIEGSDFGKSYVLCTGRNFIGRSDSMDVVIKGDNSISREKHAVILYEPKKRLFIAQAGESRELFYVNDEVVLSSTGLKQHDIITIGNTKLIFVPFCGPSFGWDDLHKEEEE